MNNNGSQKPRGNRGPKQAKGAGPQSAPSPAKQVRPNQAHKPRGQGVSKNPTMVGAAYASGQKSSAPRINATRDTNRIVHRELIASVSGTTAYTVANSFPLNPGMAVTFPWLSSQAICWEQYKFNKLEFKYYTRTGTGTPGSVMLVPDYDAADPAPISEQIASSYEDVSEDAPWKDISCLLRPSAMHQPGPRKFVRQNPSFSGGLDIKTYDSGNLFLCTTDGTAVSWGKLWVEYDVSFFIPQLPSQGTAFAGQHFPSNLNAAPTSTTLLGNAVGTATPSSNNIAAVNNEIVTFNQAGTFLLVYQAVAATSVTQSVSPTAGTGAVLDLSFGTGFTGKGTGGTGTTSMVQFVVVQTPVGGTVDFNNAVVAGASADMLIVQLPYYLT